MHLTEARAPLTERILAYDERGLAQEVSIPAERPLTVYVDKAELVTLMTMGQHPEWLVLGYLRNQRLVRDLAELVSITVDWDVDAAAVRLLLGSDEPVDLELRVTALERGEAGLASANHPQARTSNRSQSAGSRCAYSRASAAGCSALIR